MRRGKQLPPGLALLLGFALLMGCGGAGSNFGGNTGGTFSRATFSGHYALSFTGQNSQGVLREGGVLTADGRGNIMAGVLDVAQGGGVTSLAFDGTYTLNSNGTGLAKLGLPGGEISLALVMVSPGRIYAIENDGFANISGTLEQQQPGSFAAPPRGTFAFALHGLKGPGSAASVGSFTAGNGNFSGDQDMNVAGTLASQIGIAGTFSAPDNSGRGTFNLTDAAGATSSFFYYVVSADGFRMLSNDTSALSGRAERRQALTFSNAALAGNYAFGSTGDTTTVAASRMVGRFAADGNGGISAGLLDGVLNGTVQTRQVFAGNYTVAANGRGTMQWQANTGSVRRFVRIVNARRALFLLDDASRVEDGTLDLQQFAAGSNSLLNGQYGLVMGGMDTQGPVDRVGLLQADGQSVIAFSGLLNRAGDISRSAAVKGQYSVEASGRVTANVGNLSPNLIFYLFSGAEAYALQAEDGVEISGQVSRQ
jgi:hypothetical protein